MTDRKKDHIDLTEQSRVAPSLLDVRFDYEPMLTTHPHRRDDLFFYFLGSPFKAPMWVSSMTGGTALASKINLNLARACRDFGLGMGLGSCRKLLDSDEFLSDFAVRSEIGDRPLYANLGIAQVTELAMDKKLDKIAELIKKVEADGLIIHVNPIQEWMQPEGDRIGDMKPLDVVARVIDKLDIKLIVKEVGQGMGPASLHSLMKLPLAAIEFGAFGGTNFAKMEALRDPLTQDIDPICMVGHTAGEMVGTVNHLAEKKDILCREFIVSGGIRHYLDGYYYNEKLLPNSVYGQAAAYLKHAKENYEQLYHYVEKQIEGYKFAKRYLRLKQQQDK